jgi:hypothetical protein
VANYKPTHTKDRVQTLLPWCLVGCDSSPRLALSRIASRRCCLFVRTDAAVFPYMCLWRKYNFSSNSKELLNVLPWCLDGCKLELFKSSRHWRASGRMTGASGQNLGIQLLWVGICTKSYFEHLEPLFWNEDFEINDIPDYVATLHNSDFVKQDVANHKLTKVFPWRR